MAEELTYVALKPLTIRGERREVGELVPEAVNWSNIGAYLSTGRIAAVPRKSVDAESLEAAEQALEAAQSRSEEPEASEADETPDQQESGAEETPESDEETVDTQVSGYHELNVDEVVEKVKSGDLTADKVLEYELNRPGDKDPRSTLLDYLDSLENGEADEGE